MCSAEASSPTQASTNAPAIAGSAPRAGTRPSTAYWRPNASHRVTPTDPCKQSVKISSGNSCMAFTLFFCALMRFDNQIRLGYG
ncbi:Uncharacterised protein [Salmonella enterica subsp. enterica serovar Bovismorbificans]|uniref:Uncharacterized protein n=1 Tax=Salmonella enterica subsp. enterica serovar Bovismorbificans TaxID=58097 RepID=A0A655E269_SALET|nr:Uncharacterised protein [Salmonella enterica subsp. enterica serovar Bovismorbificans]CNU67494.1 Uncharacterised protein [Salmonella enterica subsp. enterica serovar Bovismorbificans]CNU98521.1 Uncharacterised protein [Salmonella enterica subsp. enterica serovar Bovismorbificans]